MCKTLTHTRLGKDRLYFYYHATATERQNDGKHDPGSRRVPLLYLHWHGTWCTAINLRQLNESADAFNP